MEIIKKPTLAAVYEVVSEINILEQFKAMKGPHREEALECAMNRLIKTNSRLIQLLNDDRQLERKSPMHKLLAYWWDK